MMEYKKKHGKDKEILCKVLRNCVTKDVCAFMKYFFVSLRMLRRWRLNIQSPLQLGATVGGRMIKLPGAKFIGLKCSKSHDMIGK